MRDELFLSKQSFVIECTISLEEIIDKILYLNVGPIGIPPKEMEATKTFKSSSSVSIKTKIDLLYDLDCFNIDTYKRLIKQTEIRNIFAHNYTISTYLDCFNLLEGKTTITELNSNLKTEKTEDNIEQTIKLLFKRNINDLATFITNKNKTIKHHNFIYTTYNHLIEEYPKCLITVIQQLKNKEHDNALQYLNEQLNNYELFLTNEEPSK